MVEGRCDVHLCRSDLSSVLIEKDFRTRFGRRYFLFLINLNKSLKNLKSFFKLLRLK